MPRNESIRVLHHRGYTIESVHRVSLAVADSTGVLVRKWGDVIRSRLFRSAAKPLQLVPLFTYGTVDRWDVSDEELAVMAGSHGGEDMHLAVLGGLARRLDITEEELLCGARRPLSGKARAQLVARGERPTAFHHPCSGKHLAMLLLCRDQGWSITDYLNEAHPVQRSMDKAIAGLCQVPEGEMTRAIDGCGAPVHGVPLTTMAQTYIRLARGDHGTGRLTGAMFRHADLVGGEGWLVSRLLRAGQGSWLAKDGAEALFCLGGPWGGLALQVEDGGERAVAPALLTVLTELDWPLEFEGWEGIMTPRILDTRGQVVGKVTVEL